MDIICTICSENYNMVSDVRGTFCGHLFHYDCITSWLERSSSCPQCRKPILAYSLNRIFLNFEQNEDYHLNQNCDAEVLRCQLQILQKENDKLRSELHLSAENLEELQVINLSLQDMDMNSVDDSQILKNQIRDIKAENVLLRSNLNDCKEELSELKMMNLTLTEKILPESKQLVEDLQQQLLELNIIKDTSKTTNRIKSKKNSMIINNGQQRRNCCSLGNISCRNEKNQFRKEFDNLKKSTFYSQNNNATSTSSNKNLDLLCGIDKEDEETLVSNLINNLENNNNQNY